MGRFADVSTRVSVSIGNLLGASWLYASVLQTQLGEVINLLLNGVFEDLSSRIGPTEYLRRVNWIEHQLHLLAEVSPFVTEQAQKVSILRHGPERI